MNLQDRRNWLRNMIEGSGVQVVAGATTDHGNPGFIIVGPEGRLISVYLAHTTETIVEMKVPK